MKLAHRFGAALAHGSAVAAAAAAVALLATAAPRALAQNSFGEATRANQPAVPTPPAAPTQPQSAQPLPQAGGAGVAQPQQPQQPQPPFAGGGNAQPQVPAGGFRLNAPADAAAGGAATADLDRLMQVERQDFGVAPTAQLHAGQMHAPTPASIPGGQVITTKGLVELLRGGQVPVLTLDVLGGAEMIQGAVYAVPAAQSGSFDDPTQQQFGQFLAQSTGGNKGHPIVLYCLSRECWMSYNAALRAINLGYTNVLWYRGGIEAWKQAGLPVQASGAR
jgi:rhodanese-related sulfurtransferase